MIYADIQALAQRAIRWILKAGTLHCLQLS
jgi:hypothetical protein